MERKRHHVCGKIILRAYQAFRSDAGGIPETTLRAGAARDEYTEEPPFDHVLDDPTDDYLERYAFDGLPYLDSTSWKYYVPLLMDYTFRKIYDNADKTMVTEGLLWSLRPPDREPPRLGSLSQDQENTIIEFLDELAFGPESACSDFAVQVLEEYWVPNALYRK